jgi:penicillin-binding protein 2
MTAAAGALRVRIQPGVVEDRRRSRALMRARGHHRLRLLLGGFWFFQVFQHAKFREMAENNHQRTLPLRAPRGVMFDRHGEVLVENRASFNISIMREHSRDLDRTMRLLAKVTGADEAGMRETVERHRREPSYRPIVVVQDATLAQVAAVTARRLDFELPDVVVQQVPTRRYPADALGAHLLGYVGEASEQQVADGGVATGTVMGTRTAGCVGVCTSPRACRCWG